MTFTAILSTTVLPLDGTYRVTTLTDVARSAALASLAGVPHYVGHPDTKSLLEALGAAQAPSKLFPGQQIGDVVLCVPIRQGMSSRAAEGFTVHQAVAELETLDVKTVERLA